MILIVVNELYVVLFIKKKLKRSFSKIIWIFEGVVYLLCEFFSLI